MAKKQVRPHRVPQRTCIACRQIQDKMSLVRIVRTSTGVVIDPRGKISGRGAYLHSRADCWQQGLQRQGRKSLLEHSLRTQLSDQERQKLEEYQQRVEAESQDDEKELNQE